MTVFKPQTPIIDWGSPLTKGLVLDIPLAERSGGRANDIVTNTQGVLTNTPVWRYGNIGSGLDFSGGSNKRVTYTTKSRQNSLTKFSIEYMFVRTGNGGAGYGVICSKSNGGTNRYLHIENDNGTGGWGHTFQSYFTSSHNRVWSIPYPTNNVLYHHVITYEFDRTASPLWYVNGVRATVTDQFNNTAGGDTPATDGTDFTLGNNFGATQGWGGYIYYCRYWDRILQHNEVRDLYLNPWKIYKPNYQIIPFSAAGGTSATFNASVLSTTASFISPVNSITKDASVLGITASLQSPSSIVNMLPTAQTSIANLIAPSLSLSSTISAPVLAVSASLQSPIQQILLQPSVMSASAAFQALADKVITHASSPVTATGTVQAPTKTILKQLSELTATASLIAPTIGIGGDITVFAPVITATATINTPTGVISKQIAVILGSAAVNDPTKLVTKEVAEQIANAQIIAPTPIAELNVVINAPVLTAIAIIAPPRVVLTGISIADTIVYDAAISAGSSTPNSIADDVIYDEGTDWGGGVIE